MCGGQKRSCENIRQIQSNLREAKHVCPSKDWNMHLKDENLRLCEKTTFTPRLRKYYAQMHYLKVKLVCSVLGSNSRSVYADWVPHYHAVLPALDSEFLVIYISLLAIEGSRMQLKVALLVWLISVTLGLTASKYSGVYSNKINAVVKILIL